MTPDQRSSPRNFRLTVKDVVETFTAYIQDELRDTLVRRVAVEGRVTRHTDRLESVIWRCGRGVIGIGMRV
jgi:hypothetical protein